MIISLMWLTEMWGPQASCWHLLALGFELLSFLCVFWCHYWSTKIWKLCSSSHDSSSKLAHSVPPSYMSILWCILLGWVSTGYVTIRYGSDAASPLFLEPHHWEWHANGNPKATPLLRTFWLYVMCVCVVLDESRNDIKY